VPICRRELRCIRGLRLFGEWQTAPNGARWFPTLAPRRFFWSQRRPALHGDRRCITGSAAKRRRHGRRRNLMKAIFENGIQIGWIELIPTSLKPSTGAKSSRAHEQLKALPFNCFSPASASCRNYRPNGRTGRKLEPHKKTSRGKLAPYKQREVGRPGPGSNGFGHGVANAKKGARNQRDAKRAASWMYEVFKSRRLLGHPNPNEAKAAWRILSRRRVPIADSISSRGIFVVMIVARPCS
jgi:hypothetical protein